MQRLGTSIAKSIKNSIRYYARESSCVGKSISSNSSSKSIIIEEFQQRGSFRSTSSLLSNYPNKSINFGPWTTVRSFSSSPDLNTSSIGTCVGEVSNELAAVDQLVDYTHLVHTVSSTLFWVFLTVYFSPRVLKLIHARLHNLDDVPYHETLFPRMEDAIYKLASVSAYVHILQTIDPALIASDSIKSVAAIGIGSISLYYINKRVEQYFIRQDLPFSVGDKIKIRDGDGYVQGDVITTGPSSIILLAKYNPFILQYSMLSTMVIVRIIVKTIAFKIDDVDKISRISKDIIKMMRLDPNVSVEMGLPYCNSSQESSCVKLTLGCDAKNKNSEKRILRNAVRIINEHGGELISDAQQD